MVSKSDVEGIIYLMDDILSDNGVPKNIRKSVSNAKERVKTSSDEVGLTGATYLLDECLNDINMPFHTRPAIMEIISELERMKEEMK